MKQFYEEPQVEVVEMEVEGAVMDGSPGSEGGTGAGFEGGGGIG